MFFYLQILILFCWDFFLCSLYPPITSDILRQEYKREFDSDLKKYKKMCAEMDDINTQLQQLNKQLDGLTEGTAQYQVLYKSAEHNLLPCASRIMFLWHVLWYFLIDFLYICYH